MKYKMHWLSRKEKVQAQQSVKKLMLTVFLGMKGTIIIDFFEKVTTLNRQNSPYLLNNPHDYIVGGLS